METGTVKLIVKTPIESILAFTPTGIDLAKAL